MSDPICERCGRDLINEFELQKDMAALIHAKVPKVDEDYSRYWAVRAEGWVQAVELVKRLIKGAQK